MITSETPPTLNIARETFGNASVMMFLKQHLYLLAKFYGVTTNDEQINDIAYVITTEAGNLKTTELMLFFQMFKEGYFRNGDDNRAKMFGSFNGDVISDCLYKFKFEYRNRIIDKHEGEQRKKQREIDDAKAMTYDERLTFCLCQSFVNKDFLEFIKKNKWLKEKDMVELEDFVKERNALLRLKQRVEELIQANESGNDTQEVIDKLKRGVVYLDKLAEEREQKSNNTGEK